MCHRSRNQYQYGRGYGYGCHHRRGLVGTAAAAAVAALASSAQNRSSQNQKVNHPQFQPQPDQSTGTGFIDNVIASINGSPSAPRLSTTTPDLSEKGALAENGPVARTISKQEQDGAAPPPYELSDDEASPSPDYSNLKDTNSHGHHASAVHNNTGTAIAGLREMLPASNLTLVSSITKFEHVLASFRAGSSGISRCSAKRAAKDVYHTILDSEIDRRAAMNAGGRLRCGQRKAIKRELRPVKESLWSAVRDANRQRRTAGHGCC